mgnify:CR=1 FL=1
MHTPHKAKKQLNKAFLLQLKSQNETKVKVEIRHLPNFCNKMPCVSDKFRLLEYLCTPSALSLSNLCYFSSTPNNGAVAK